MINPEREKQLKYLKEYYQKVRKPKYHTDPEYRLKVLSYNRKYSKKKRENPENREKQNAYLREWRRKRIEKDPDYREKLREASRSAMRRYRARKRKENND